EIYNQVEQMEELAEALCIGHEWDDDVRVILFFRLAPDVTLTEYLVKAIKTRVLTGASPRHVPAVNDLPQGKLDDLA
ncbi:acetoacetate--CoA ligase, partial [Rhizobium ruizarguesonis]